MACYFNAGTEFWYEVQFHIIQGRAHINSRDRGKHGHEDALQLGAPRGPLHFPTERVRLLQRVEVGLRTLNALAVFLHLNTNCTNDHTIPE
jgi:hypothetical protein